MRFLLGIFVGAGATLLVATAIDAPTSPVLAELRQVWERLITVTGNTLFRSDGTAAAGRQPSAGTSPARQPAGLSAAATNHGTAVPAGRESGKPALEPAGGPGASQSETAPAADANRLAQQTEPSAVGTVPDDGAHSFALASTPGTPAAGPDGDRTVTVTATQAVWVPFHSEMSARGFARRLAEQFGHPFSVEREGPGAYNVVFSYDHPEQREQMLADVKEVTGQ